MRLFMTELYMYKLTFCPFNKTLQIIGRIFAVDRGNTLFNRFYGDSLNSRLKNLAHIRPIGYIGVSCGAKHITIF